MGIQTEKERSERVVRGAFNLSDISRGYLAFLTNNVHNENNKIINEKMDQILVGRIFDSNLMSSGIQFKDVLSLIDRLATDNDIRTWLKTPNNLIGFCVGIRNSYTLISHMSNEDFKIKINIFEEAFSIVNPSKVNLGKYRRELSKLWIGKLKDYIDFGPVKLGDVFVVETV